MSFSVHARAFVPSAAANPGSESRQPAADAADTKDCVCMAFYENGRCPYGARCEHAHRFAELNPDTQVKLLGSVPVESIPAHFFGPSQANEEPRTGAAADSASRKSFGNHDRFGSLQGSEGERTVSTRRRPPPGKDRQLIVSHVAAQPALDAACLSSRTSSSADSVRASSGAHPAKGASSPPASATTAVHSAAAAEAGSFKMHLPLRCRYPHRSIPGTYYDVLALPQDAAHGDIIAKYRAWQRDGFKRMRLVDPVGAEAVDRMIVEARNVLGNPTLRSAYDQQLPGAAAKAPLPAQQQQQQWGSGSCNAGLASASTTPSKHRLQGQSSTTSSTSDTHRKLDESHHRLGRSSSNSSFYHADHAAPMVTISSLRNVDSIW